MHKTCVEIAEKDGLFGIIVPTGSVSLMDKRRYKIRIVGIVGTYPFIYSAVSSTCIMPYS